MLENKKIKILEFPIRNNKGGVTQYIYNQWKWLDKERFHVDFVTLDKEIDFAKEIEDLGGKIHYITTTAEKDLQKFVAEIDAVLQKGYDVVHLHTGMWKSFVIEECAKKNKVRRIVIHAHNTGFGGAKTENENVVGSERHFRLREKIDESVATDFWACSKLAAEWLYGDKIPLEKIKIIPDCIETQCYLYDLFKRNETRKHYGWENNFVIGHVGRFAYQKNHRFLIEVFGHVCAKISNAKLVLVGNGTLLDEMKQLIQQKGLEDRVVFMGNISEVEKIYQAMDVFAMPSLFEGFGIALLEAQIAGLPCVASTYIPPEVKIHNEVSFLDLDVDTWVEQIVQYYHNPRRIEITKENVEKYDVEKQIEKLERLLER